MWDAITCEVIYSGHVARQEKNSGINTMNEGLSFSV